MVRVPLPPPRAGFLVEHPAHFIALGFGAGLAPRIQGTFGTLVAFPLAWALYAVASPVVYLAATLAVFLIGIWASAETGRALGVVDHGSIVIDEVAAFMLVLFFTPHTVAMQVAAFLLFRLFDIVKPPPIGLLDARLKNGFGVMADDILAAVYAILCVLALVHFTR